MEMALLLPTVLAPLLLGVVYYGYFFWRAQQVPVLAPQLDQASLVGTYCAGTIPQLTDRVRALTLVSVQDLEGAAGLPVTASDVTAAVVDYVPDGLGVLVRVSVTSSVLDSAVPLVPLPHGGRLTQDALLRLENVRISTGSC